MRCVSEVFLSCFCFFFWMFLLKKMSAGNNSLADSYQTDVWEGFCFLLQLLHFKSFRENVKELLTTFLNLLKCSHTFKSPLKWMLNGFNWNKMYGLSPLLCSWESCSRCVCPVIRPNLPFANTRIPSFVHLLSFVHQLWIKTQTISAWPHVRRFYWLRNKD